MKNLISSVVMVALIGMMVGVAAGAATTAAVTATVTAQNVSVSLNQSSFAYGTMSVNTASSTLQMWGGAGITATNDGNVTSDLTIYGADTAAWTLNSSNATLNNYIHRFCKDTDVDCTTPPTNYTALTTSPATLKAAVAASGTYIFQLQITTPNTTNNYTQQSAAVTVQAAAS